MNEPIDLLRCHFGLTIAEARLALHLKPPLCATFGLMQRSKQHSLNHFVGAGDKRRRNVETERLRSVDVDGQLDAGNSTGRSVKQGEDVR